MSGTAGVYRSEKYVVVERHRHRFPGLCIWCSAALVENEVPASPDPDGDVKPPMCRSCAATRNRLPKSVGLFGIITFSALLLTGFVDLVIAWRLHVAASGFQAAREDQQYVWIGSAHQGFLSALPQWPGMKLSEMSHR